MSSKTCEPKRLAPVTHDDSVNQVINSYAYTYYASGASTDLIQTETITNGEPIDSFVAGTTTYTPNNLNQLASTSNPNRTYTYDDDGNMTTGFTPEGYTLTMTYDAENRMKTAEYTDSNSIVHRTEYSYGGDSLVTEVKKYDGGTLTSDTRYVRAGFLPVQERDANNVVTREYTWGLNLGSGIGGLLNLNQNGNNYSYLYDGKGNVSNVIDSSQSIVANYRYDPFGVLMKKTATIEQPYGFSTKPYDSQTGLHDFGYRPYMSAVGKWPTRDPLEEYGGINLYQMTGNNAVNFVDPLGLEIRVYSSNAFGISGLNHAFVYSTETGRGKGTNGSSLVTLGNGVGDLNNPYTVVKLPAGMSENEFMNSIINAKGWNNWVWIPWLNDCHTDLKNAFNQAGVQYPGAPNGRVDIDDTTIEGLKNFLSQLFGLKYWLSHGRAK